MNLYMESEEKITLAPGPCPLLVIVGFLWPIKTSSRGLLCRYSSLSVERYRYERT